VEHPGATVMLKLRVFGAGFQVFTVARCHWPGREAAVRFGTSFVLV
jgi:hypothetical protein